jgi:hypothetical protein
VSRPMMLFSLFCRMTGTERDAVPTEDQARNDVSVMQLLTKGGGVAADGGFDSDCARGPSYPPTRKGPRLGRVATPFPPDSCILYFMPIYPGALSRYCMHNYLGTAASNSGREPGRNKG